MTFHEVTPILTRVLLVLEYHPQGLFERTGNIWRAQGRRARLEFKHFRRHVMSHAILHPDEIEGWRGEIRDSEVVKDHETALREEKERRPRRSPREPRKRRTRKSRKRSARRKSRGTRNEDEEDRTRRRAEEEERRGRGGARGEKEEPTRRGARTRKRTRTRRSPRGRSGECARCRAARGRRTRGVGVTTRRSRLRAVRPPYGRQPRHVTHRAGMSTERDQ